MSDAVTNAEYFGRANGAGGRISLLDAFRRWAKHSGSDANDVTTALNFASAAPIRVLEYDYGHLFVVTNSGKKGLDGCYATVYGYDVQAFKLKHYDSTPGCEILARVYRKDGTVSQEWMTVDMVGKATVPPELLALAKAQLQENCPLKTAGCSR